MSIHHIMTLLEFCLKNTHFLFQCKYNDQIYGAALHSPISPIVTNFFMEKFETRSINTAPNPPRLWLRYIDDTFAIQKAEHSQRFPQHIISIDPHIQCPAETPNTYVSISFLDTLVSPGPDTLLLTIAYRKPTHTDLYLHWDSHHNLSTKYSVLHTLKHRARTIYANPQLLYEDKEDMQGLYKDASIPFQHLIHSKSKVTTNKHHSGPQQCQ